MNAWNRPQTAATSQSAATDQGLRSYMLRVYNYMASGVLLTAIVSYFAGNSEAFLNMVIGQNASGAYGLTPLGWIISLAPIAMVLVLGFRAHKMSAESVQMAFWGYAALMGLSLFSIFLVYTGESIARVFVITAGTFSLLSIVGYTTKRDLTSMGTFLFVGMLAVFFVSIANMFMKVEGLGLALSYVGVLLALGLTAYDTQKVKEAYYMTGGNPDAAKKAAALGALSLYFDFIYLFVNLLRIMGDRR